MRPVLTAVLLLSGCVSALQTLPADGPPIAAEVKVDGSWVDSNGSLEIREDGTQVVIRYTDDEGRAIEVTLDTVD